MSAVTPTIINKLGRITGWNKVILTLFGRDIEAITEISYDDEQDKDNEYGQGKYPMGQGEGNYKAKASISLFSEEVIGIQKSLPVGFRITDIPAFDVPIEYEYKGVLVKDVLRNASFKNNGREVKQGDTKIVTKFDLLISHIDWNI
jgi:hypothetical protein